MTIIHSNLRPICNKEKAVKKMEKKPKFELFIDEAEQFRFRLVAANGEVIF